MAEITRKRTGELLRALFDILMPLPEGLRANKALEMLAGKVTLTAYESGNYPSGNRRFEKIVRFATVDCVKAGWLQKEDGTWTITDEGREAYKQYADPEAFYRRATKLYAQWRSAQPDAAPAAQAAATDTEAVDEVKEVAVSFEAARDQARDEIDRHLAAMPPMDFQQLVADLLGAMDWHVSWIAPPGKDGGIDIVAWPDPLGTKLPRIKVQVKRQQATITVDGLRSFMALLGDDDVGLFVSLGGFTKDAQTEARTQAKRRVTLIDSSRLLDLWQQHYAKLSEAAQARLPLRPIYFLAPKA